MVTEQELQTLYSKFEGLKQVTRKLRTISRFFKRQVLESDIHQWVLPAFRAVVSNTHEATDEETVDEAIDLFASAVAEMPAEHQEGIMLLSECGRTQLGMLVLHEEYKSAAVQQQLYTVRSSPLICLGTHQYFIYDNVCPLITILVSPPTPIPEGFSTTAGLTYNPRIYC